MIEYKRNGTRHSAEEAPSSLKVKVFGIGGAGSNILDRMAVDGVSQGDLVNLHTDTRMLTSSIAGQKIQIGRNLTMGLGCGGDPELGREAALEARDEIREAVKGSNIVFLCAGLGGGTGSGAAPIVAKIAREEGCFVVVFVTLPFRFEGRRRLQQANVALSELKASANALLTFENDRMGELIVPKDGVQQAFAAADKMICQSIRAIANLVEQPGMIRIGMDDLLTVLKGDNSRCLFGFGRGSGKTRATRAVEEAMASPLLDRGMLLRNTSSVLVHISGGESLSLAEVESVMDLVSEQVDEHTQILFGVSSAAEMDDAVCVTVIGSVERDVLMNYRSQEEEEPAQPKPEPETTRENEPAREEPGGMVKVNAPVTERAPEPEPEPQPEPEQVAHVEPAPPLEPEPPAEPERYHAPVSLHAKPGAVEQPGPVTARQESPETLEKELGPELPFGSADDAEAEGDYDNKITDFATGAPGEHEEQEPRREERREPERNFSVVEDPEPSVPKIQPHPKVRIEFSEDDGSDKPSRGGRTITLQQPEPSITSRERPPREQAPRQAQPPQPSQAQHGEHDDQFDETSVGEPHWEDAPQAREPERPRQQPRPTAVTEKVSEYSSAYGADYGDSAIGKLEYQEEGGGDEPPEDGVREQPAQRREPVDMVEAMPRGSDARSKASQQMLDLEPPARGRFDKGEPTIIDGEDLDIPTYLRKRKAVG